MSKREPSDVEISVKKKRKRTAFSHVQQAKLENAFQKDHWPTRNKKERLAVELDMTLRSVRTWFQNRRAKEKREEDFREMQAAKEKSVEKKSSLFKNASHIKKNLKIEPQSIKIAATGSPGRLFSPSHTFVTRSKSKKQVRVKELQQSDTAPSRSVTSGSEASERTSEEEEEEEEDVSTAEDEGDVEDEADGVGAEKSCTEQTSSDSCVEESTNNTNNRSSATEESRSMRRYVQSCQTEGDIVIAKHTSRITADMFTTLIDMMAITEGGIVKPTDPAFNMATNNALYGIQLKAGETLLYDKANGFYFENTDSA